MRLTEQTPIEVAQALKNADISIIYGLADGVMAEAAREYRKARLIVESKAVVLDSELKRAKKKIAALDRFFNSNRAVVLCREEKTRDYIVSKLRAETVSEMRENLYTYKNNN